MQQKFKKLISKCHEQLHPKSDNLKEVDKFPEKDGLPKPNGEE